MNYNMVSVSRNEMFEILENAREYRENVENLKSNSTFTHLSVACYDWNVEEKWDCPCASAMAIMDGDVAMGVIFYAHTKRNAPFLLKHFSLRHMVVFEEHRGKGLSYYMMAHLFEVINSHRTNIRWLRFYSDKNTIKFYEKLGFEWFGNSHTDLPFAYTNVTSDDVKISNETFNKQKDELFLDPMDRSRLYKQYEKLKTVSYHPPASTKLNKFFN